MPIFSTPTEAYKWLLMKFARLNLSLAERRLNHWYAAYADPACDGKGEAVHGLGQLRRIGPASGGKPAFI